MACIYWRHVTVVVTLLILLIRIKCTPGMVCFEMTVPVNITLLEYSHPTPCEPWAEVGQTMNRSFVEAILPCTIILSVRI